MGADAELRRLFSAASKEIATLAHTLAADDTTWKFYPSVTPHFGGKWEVAVKSTKFYLRRLIDDAVLTYEEFSTLLTQIETVLNSRPLGAISKDPADIEILTPVHFLVGGPLTVIPEPSLTEIPASRLSRWQLLRQMLDWFWQRWSLEYLQRLQIRNKWRRPEQQIAVRALVLVIDERYPPSKWPLAHVIAFHPGNDGLVRVVAVRMAVSTLKRPITKLCPFPIA